MNKKYFFSLTLILLLCFAACKKDPAIVNPGKHLKISVFVKNLENPWGMAFLPNGDFLFCERPGNLNLLKKNSSDYNMIMFRNVLVAEGGLLGIAVDPEFNTNHFIYIYETVTAGNQVVRFKMENDLLTEDQVILSGIPRANNHDGGALRFGPDGYLYLGTGDATNSALSQDTSSLAGKILRLDRDGNAAPGNPFHSKIWTYGHRNVQGFDWNVQGRMFATEHGPTGEFGWYAHDEVNLIEPGKNYGWPIALGGTETDSLTPPVYCSGTDTWAPSGCTFIKGKDWGSWENNFILGALKGERLIHFSLNADGDGIMNKYDTLNGVYLRLRNIIQGPDGALYFCSSNITTLSVTPLISDDKIYRMAIE